ncbi:MAG: hypothetical protein SNH88_04185 [Rikenellaceae bacterium]
MQNEYRWYLPQLEDQYLLGILHESRPEILYKEQPIDTDTLLKLSSEDVIDRFLENNDDKRIIAEQGEPTSEIEISADLEEEEEFISVELAEIYLAQGLTREAIEIYRKLSLLNSEKSVYFAKLIAEAEARE